jgi:hypothetical protein
MLCSVVNPGVVGSPRLHQIVGGNAFNASLDGDLSTEATYTSCTPNEDFSNYWTAVIYLRARKWTFKRVNTLGNPFGYSIATGVQTVCYLSRRKMPYSSSSRVCKAAQRERATSIRSQTLN